MPVTVDRVAAALRRARRLPPGSLLAEAVHRARRGAAGCIGRVRDAVRSTYARATPAGSLQKHAPALDPHRVAVLVPDLAARCARYLEHRFDLLGSGWLTVRHGMSCGGFEGNRYRAAAPADPDAEGRWLAGEVSRANLAAARAAWRLVDPAYRPIDWHIDFRSGYRWSPRTWYGRVRYGHRPGVDVRVPWELARMQHLPQMALAFGCARAGVTGFPPSSRYQHEFRHQVLDFVATNPPRHGVNWRSAMEVAIRVANWLLAHDLFRAYGARFDSAFDAIFRRSVREHGRHIAGNLERTPLWRNNHYLANLAGLLFVAAYLPPDRETTRWWQTAAQALEGEIERQFLPDGGHFEASTGYHALAAEVAVYAVAMLFAGARPRGDDAEDAESGRGAASLSDVLPARLGRMAEFVMHLTKPDGRIAQIGDHDSGRLFKLQPTPRTRSDGGNRVSSGPAPRPLSEEHLVAGHVVAGITGLLGRADLAAWCQDRWLDEPLIAGLAGETPWRAPGRQPARTGAEGTALERGQGFEALCGRLRGAPAVETSRAVLAVGGGPSLREELRIHAYPDFGAYVFRSSRLFLCLRAGSVRHDGTGGHAHVDQLCLEVSIDGASWIRDAGSYVYTADRQWRNAYRSSRAHFVPYALDGESALWCGGPFDLPLEVQVRQVALDASGVAVDLLLAGNRIGQILTIARHEITVETRILEAPRSGRLRARCHSGHEVRYLFGRDVVTTAAPFSPGYGLRGEDSGRGS